MGREEFRTFLKRFSLVKAYASGDAVKELEAKAKGSICRACSGTGCKVRSWMACRSPIAWHIEREMSGTWETIALPVITTGRTLQQSEESLMSVRESDRLIVLRGGSADHMGKGTTELCGPQREHGPDMIMKDWIIHANLTAENIGKWLVRG